LLSGASFLWLIALSVRFSTRIEGFVTTQTKKFIAPEDIVGLRIKCSHSQCQAEIVLPIDKPLEAKNLALCPLPLYIAALGFAKNTIVWKLP
jgi:hypothetical protein